MTNSTATSHLRPTDSLPTSSRIHTDSQHSKTTTLQSIWQPRAQRGMLLLLWWSAAAVLVSGMPPLSYPEPSPLASKQAKGNGATSQTRAEAHILNWRKV